MTFKDIKQKVLCKLGYHYYRDELLKVELLYETEDCWQYKISNKCLYCDKEYWTRIPIIKPVKTPHVSKEIIDSVLGEDE